MGFPSAPRAQLRVRLRRCAGPARKFQDRPGYRHRTSSPPRESAPDARANEPGEAHFQSLVPVRANPNLGDAVLILAPSARSAPGALDVPALSTPCNVDRER